MHPTERGNRNLVNMAPKRQISCRVIDIASIPPSKRARTATGQSLPREHAIIARKLLAQFYNTTQTLRQYHLSSMPAASRIRRKKLESFGRSTLSADQSCLTLEPAVALDHILVCLRGTTDSPAPGEPFVLPRNQNAAVSASLEPQVRQSEVRYSFIVLATTQYP